MYIGNKQKSNKKVKLQTFKKKEGLNSGEKKLDRRAQGSLIGSVGWTKPKGAHENQLKMYNTRPGI